MAFVRAARKDDIPVGKIYEFQVAGQAIAIANVSGKFHAINSVCAHEGGPLGEGELEGPRYGPCHPQLSPALFTAI